MDKKFTPDCLNVYAEGPVLRKRNGYSRLNTSAVVVGSNCNAIYDWVQTASSQFLISVFGNSLYKMPSSGSVWSGTFSAIASDNSLGTSISDAITNFVTYQGVLMWTTENQDHPQRLLVTDASHKNIEDGGSGEAPNGKYIQIWKDHVWILNISAGGVLEEDGTGLANWTTTGGGAAAVTSGTAVGVSAFLFTGTTGTTAEATRVVSGGINDSYVVEMRTRFSTLGTSTGGHATMSVWNGVVKLDTQWSDGGLRINDGTTFNAIGINLVSEGTWNTWKFYVTAGTATAARVDIYKDNVPVGLQFKATNAVAASDGSVRLQAILGAGTAGVWYLDYININNANARTNYYTDGNFENWISSSQSSNTDSALPSQAFIHCRMNDNAASATITNVGSSGNNLLYQNTAGDINTNTGDVTGKITSALTFTTAPIFAVVSVGDISTFESDSVGSICMWFNVVSHTTYNPYLFSVSQTSGVANSFGVRIGTGVIFITTNTGGSANYQAEAGYTVSTGSWIHLMITKGSALNFYVNNVHTTFGVSIGAGTSWFVDAGEGTADLDVGRIGCLVTAGSNTLGFNGYIDDFRYYRTELSSDERAAIYNSGSGNEAVPVTVQEGTTVKQGDFSYRVNNDGDYAVISQTLASGGSLAGNESVFGVFGFVTNNANYKLRIDDGTTTHDSTVFVGNGTWQYQTLISTPVAGAGTVKAQIIMMSSGTGIFDFAAVVPNSSPVSSDNSDRIQRSAVTLYNDWDGTDSGSNDIYTAGDRGLTGSVVIADRMYVFKAYSIHRFTYTASTPLVDIKQIRNSIGTKSQRSIKTIVLPGEGEVCIFLGTDKRLYKFDGYDTTSLSDAVEVDNGITDYYFQNINSSALDKVHAVVYDDKPWYELFIPLGTDVVCKHSIIYNYKTKSFWPNDNRLFRCSVTSDNGSGQRVVYAGDNSAGFVNLTSSTNSDAGTAINAYWSSVKLADPTILSAFDEIELITDSVAATPTLSWREDFNATYTDKTLSTSTNVHNYNPRLKDNYIQVKIADNSSNPGFKVWLLRVLEKSFGHGK